MPLSFDDTYARLPEHFFAPVEPTPVREPSLFALNEPLATLLGGSAEEFSSAEFVSVWAGNRVLPGSLPIALAYAGHQFGHFVPSLGDGRAILLGETIGRDGRRYDVQLKGSGRTPFSRGGDGRATLASVLREYLVSEGMAALGVPTTRSLAAVATGDTVWRERPRPGGVLTRIASSHLRVGTFEYFAARRDVAAVQRLADYAYERHCPERPAPLGRALALFEHVLEGQAELIARWMSFGFIHGVMNTDNCSIACETIDYGPCAFLDSFEPGRVFSSIDERGRYAFDQQPEIALWNVTRLGIALASAIDENPERATALLRERLAGFESRFDRHFAVAFGRKLGLSGYEESDDALLRRLLGLMARARADFTNTFRALYDVAAGAAPEAFLSGWKEGASEGASEAAAWLEAWRARRGEAPAELEAMRTANPAFVPRNHRVEEALAAAEQGDRSAFDRLLSAIRRPFDDQPELADLRQAPGDEQWTYRTFCGT
ncbi:MAG TPA: YdiU family protein [Polyangiaceae bacterium]|nr:YdiU family protein [Polyangiaceae bacterium]